jgi:hypothetical protein
LPLLDTAIRPRFLFYFSSPWSLGTGTESLNRPMLCNRCAAARYIRCAANYSQVLNVFTYV